MSGLPNQGTLKHIDTNTIEKNHLENLSNHLVILEQLLNPFNPTGHNSDRKKGFHL